MQEIKLVKRAGSDGFIRFYIKYNPPLEIPEQKPMKEEALNLKLFSNPKYPFQETTNKQIEELAQKVYAARMEMIARREYRFQLQEPSNMDFLQYFEDNGDYRGCKYVGARKAFSSFVGGKCRIKDINVPMFDKYKKFLATYTSSKKKKIISHNTACAYFSTLLSMLHLAYKDGLIKKDYSVLVNRMTWDHEIKKDYLSEEEITKIENTEFPEKNEVRLAALLSIYTGLRRSDILNLKWKDIKKDQSSGLFIDINVHKTGSRLLLPLSKKSVDVLNECGMDNPSSEKVFNTITETILNNKIQRLIKKSGINKHITFHCFRHTFAMTLLNRGADIYTISKLLGHAQINNTTVYAKLNVNDLKQRISELMDDN